MQKKSETNQEPTSTIKRRRVRRTTSQRRNIMLSSGEAMKVTCPSFSGKPKEFNFFWVWYKAFAMVGGFADMLKSTKHLDLPENEGNLSADANTAQREEAAVKHNSIAIANFTMAFKNEALMTMIYKTQTSE